MFKSIDSTMAAAVRTLAQENGWELTQCDGTFAESLAGLKDMCNQVQQGCKYVILRDTENNYYDDSDFVYVALDLDVGTIISHVHSTTRFGGHRDLDNSIMLSKVPNISNPLVLAAVHSIVAYAAVNTAMMHCMDHTYIMYSGDTVQVTNQRARKHKGEIFTVADTQVWRSQYGKALTTSFVNADLSIKTNRNNCTLVKPSDHRLANIAGRALVSLNYSQD